LKRIDAPHFVSGMLFDERTAPLRQSLRLLPNTDEVVEMINTALAEL
jgi:hypothetical protein